MKRRELLAGLLPVAVVPLARAQQPGKKYRIAIFHPTVPVSELMPEGGIFAPEFRRLGYEEGRNLTVERYSGGGQQGTWRQIASQIVATRPDLVFSWDVGVQYLAEAASGKLPIVGVTRDPLVLGLTTSLSRPSANVTGIVTDAGVADFIEKRFEVLREVRPGLSNVAVFFPRYRWETPVLMDDAHRIAKRLGIRFTCLCVESPVNEASYRLAFGDVERQRPDAIMIGSGPENPQHADLIISLVNGARIPAQFSGRFYVERGGLVSYESGLTDGFRYAVRQMDMILRGRPVSEVPFYQATTYEIAINLSTARMIGVEIPPSLLARAAHIVE